VIAKPLRISKIDRGNPLSSGLVFCSAFNEMAGNARDLITGASATSAGNPVWSKTGMMFDGVSANQSFAVSDANMCGALTILIRADIANSATYRTLISKSQTDGGSYTPFDIYVGNSGNYIACNRSNLTYRYTRSANYAITPGKMQSIVITFSSGNIAIPGQWYTDGIPTISNIMGSGTGNASGNSVPISFIRADSGTKASGNFECAMIWNRSLSYAEVVSISTNPWQILAQSSPSRIMRLLSASGFKGVSRGRGMAGTSRGRMV
jgi:Concanavalin A-like lectin/glucanases superfamily